MKHQIAKEPTEELELNVEDGRFALIQRRLNPANPSIKVIIMNQREALKLNQAITEEILKL